MKTYLLNIPNELKNFCQKKDVVALLCSKSWEVFNDEGNKQILIFQKNGALLVSTNGDVINSTWQFISANKSIIISVEGKTTMLNPVFVDGVVLAMGKNGTQECLFMIDETRTDVMPNRTFGELEDYFIQKALENSPEYIAARQAQLQQEEMTRQARLRQEEKARQAKIAEQKKRIICEHQEEINAALLKRRNSRVNLIFILIAVFLITLALTFILPNPSTWRGLLIVICGVTGIILVGCLALLSEDVKPDIESEIVEKYLPK
ncbi:MAG: OmpH family outer membrane protein [bacterium]|nr:OmpH family outer membrane protein [Candidatus Limimorpha equi]